ncbi:PREDICTED: poly(A) polymerase type 3 [Diuraphis noxia]|uniref:poly(A) polymerase type 3 n=1 Tax=Diuraphis noxia TaxID=143948 RepID=UPI0007637B21|nr:PREDICTED: poly(A) polymerase type 3 [Diuraphis noxia]XP_015364235.1 PREDICTED: poly(A) polymerase type 3 [Diuraphis noxia]
MYGMTSAISDALPTDIDIQLTKSLDDALSREKVITTDEDLSQRLEVLSMLNNLAKEWIREVSMERNLPEITAENVGGLVCTFGSYRLGVYHKGADIDAIVIVPRHITRADYFATFYNKLKENPSINNVRAVEEAFVPVIKMIIQGIEIDMLFARLALKEVHEDTDLQQDDLLRNLNPKCVRSLNGCRVTDSILRLVPNRESFKKTLIAIKLWAKRHRVYSNALGYLGGVSWAMLVARVCQLYPNAAPATLIHKFFLIFSKWQWPQPVLLKPSYFMDLGYPVWDPRVNMADRNHVMPIITPVYPQQNSTFNVSHSTLAIIQDEFKTSLDIMGEILTGESSWSKIFQPSKFFTKYRYFLAITVFANCDEELLEWRGLVESRLRFLPTSLEEIECVQRSHLNPDQFVLPYDKSQGRPSSVWFVGLEISKSNGTVVQLDFSSHIRDFCLLVKSRAHAIFKDGMDIQVNHLKRKDLKDYVPDELKKEKAIPNTVGSKIIARLSTEGRHSISELEKESQKSPTSRKRSIEDEIDDNIIKKSLSLNEEMFVLGSVETQRSPSSENKSNNLVNTLLSSPKENHSVSTENETKENINFVKESLLLSDAKHSTIESGNSLTSPVSNKCCADDETDENDQKKLRLLHPTVA